MICLSVFLSFCLSVFLSFCLSVFLSFCLFCLSVFLSLSHFLSIKTNLNFGTHFLSFLFTLFIKQSKHPIMSCNKKLFWLGVSISFTHLSKKDSCFTLRWLADGKLIGVDPIYVASPQSWPISPEGKTQAVKVCFAGTVFAHKKTWKQPHIKNINIASTLDLHCLDRPPSDLETSQELRMLSRSLSVY